MMDVYSKLERLANLHKQGVLSDEEFEAEKKRLIKPSVLDRVNRHKWFIVAVVVIIFLIAILAIFLSIYNQNVSPGVEKSYNSASSFTAPEIISRDEKMTNAFSKAFGRGEEAIVTVNGESVTFRPRYLLDAGRYSVLVSVGFIADAPHVSGGKVSLHYGIFEGNDFQITRTVLSAVEAGSWGQFSEIGVSKKMTKYPVIYVEGGGTWQGHTCSWITLLEVDPDGPNELADILVSASNGGAGDDQPAVDFEGKITNVNQDKSFDVVYTGTETLTEHYVRSGQKYDLVGGPSKVSGC